MIINIKSHIYTTSHRNNYGNRTIYTRAKAAKYFNFTELPFEINSDERLLIKYKNNMLFIGICTKLNSHLVSSKIKYNKKDNSGVCSIGTKTDGYDYMIDGNYKFNDHIVNINNNDYYVFDLVDESQPK